MIRNLISHSLLHCVATTHTHWPSCGEEILYFVLLIFEMGKKSKKKKFQPLDVGELGDLGLEGDFERPILDPNSRIDSYEEDRVFLTSQIGDFVNYTFVVVSTNEFRAEHGERFYPAEVGLVQYTFKNGIKDQFHCFFDPQICREDLATVQEHSKSTHGIPVPSEHQSALATAAATVENIERIFHFSHIYRFGGIQVAYLFCEDKEIVQVERVFEWCSAHKANFCRPRLIRLSHLHQFYSQHLGAELPRDNSKSAFKTTRFQFENLCYFHKCASIANCALSKATQMCYILSKEFCQKLHVQLTIKHLPANFIE